MYGKGLNTKCLMSCLFTMQSEGNKLAFLLTRVAK